MMDKKLSICMIVGKEEANLKRCLDSFLPIIHEPWCELIIVVTQMGDRTIEVAQEYTRKVYYQTWREDFSFHRNHAISHATGERIMTVDADEELPQTCLYRLEDYILNPKYKDVETFFFTIHSFHRPDRSLASDILQPRIFRNDNGNPIYSGIVHNRPDCKEPFFFANDVTFNHYGYMWDNDPELLKQKTLRSLPLLESEYSKKPGDLHVLTHLVKTYYTAGQHDKVTGVADEWIALMNGVRERGEFHTGWFSFLEGFVHIMAAYLSLGNEQKALETIKEAEQFSNRLMVMYFAIGNWYYVQKRYADAVPMIERGVKIASEPGDPHELLMTDYARGMVPQALYALSIEYLLDGRVKEAGEYLNQAIALNAGRDNMRYDLWNEERVSAKYLKGA